MATECTINGGVKGFFSETNASVNCVKPSGDHYNISGSVVNGSHHHSHHHGSHHSHDSTYNVSGGYDHGSLHVGGSVGGSFHTKPNVMVSGTWSW